jgi:hypothetical protein
MKFRDVPAALRPTSEAGGNTRVSTGTSPDRNMIDSVIDRWRASTMSKGQQLDDDSGDLGSFRDEVSPLREEVPRYPAAPPTQPGMQPPAYAPPAAAPGAPPAPGPRPAAAPAPPQRPSILRRPISAEPLGPNNPAPLPSRYR